MIVFSTMPEGIHFGTDSSRAAARDGDLSIPLRTHEFFMREQL